MTKRPNKPAGNPYKMLYWMGTGVAVLLFVVVGLVIWLKPAPFQSADPERTVLWLFDPARPDGTSAVAIFEESRSRATLTAVPFPPPEAARKAHAEQGPRRAVEAIASFVDRKIHHRVFLPYSVVATLIDAAGGISVDGRQMNGGAALTFIQEGGEQETARRATQVMLALSDAVTTRGINMDVSQGLSLARQIDTDLDLTAIPTVLGRWAGYASPSVASPAQFDGATLQKLLLPDPAEPARKN